MGFYDSNPQEKDAFAQAGAIHDGTAPDSASSSTATSPGTTTPTAAAISTEEGRSGMQVQTDPGSGKFYEGNTNPYTDPAFAGGDPTSNAMHAQGLAFSQGGAVPEDDTQTDQSGGDDAETDQSNPIDALFAHGRQKMGLMQTAGAIPATPGTQSPGQPPPAPGPLPPTANPFGKRPTPPTPGRLSEVVPYPSPGGPGPTTAATPYYMGQKKDPKVAPIPPGKSADAGAIPEEEEAA